MRPEDKLGPEDDAGVANDLPPDDLSDQAPPEPVTEGETPPPKGESAEDLRTQVKSMQEEFRNFQLSVQRDLSQAQNDVAYYRGLAERGKTAEAEAPAEESGPDETEFYKNPLQASRKIVQDEIAKEKEKARNAQLARHVNEMRGSYERGRDVTIRKYPKLFQGIERQVEDLMFEAVRTNRIADPREAESEQNWVLAAESIRRAKGELDFTKYYGSRPPSPQSEPFSETPTGTRYGTRSPGPAYDDEAEDFLRAVNRGEKKPITKEEIAQEFSRRTMPRRPR